MRRTTLLLLALAACLCLSAAPASARTPPRDTTPPRAPSNLHAIAGTNGVLLVWLDLDFSIEHFGVYADGKLVDTTSWPFDLVQLSCGRPHTVGVDAVDRAGNHSSITSIPVTTRPCPAPSTPSGLTVTPRAGGLAASWHASTGDVAGYRVYLDGTLVTTTDDTSFTIPVACGTTHEVAVEAVAPGGRKSAQTSASATAPPCGPAPPTGLTASATTSGVTLRWQASTDPHVLGYGIYVDGTLVASTVATGYTLDVACGSTHELGVDAELAGSDRSARATTTVTTPLCEGGGPALYVSPTGSDTELCLQPTPCATFDRAYHLAVPGQRVIVAGGTYPTQTVTVDATKLEAPANVLIAPADGARVELAGDLIVYGSHVTFRDLHLRKLVNQASPGALTSHDVLFDNLDGEAFSIGPNYRITIKNGDWGPSIACFPRGTTVDTRTGDPIDPAGWCPAGGPYADTGNDGRDDNLNYENNIGPDGEIPNQWPHAVTIDGARIHDQNSLDLDHLHTGGLFLISGYDIAIRNTVFQRNAVYDMQVQDFSNPDCCGQTYGPVRDVVLENNWFAAPVMGLNDAGGGATANDLQPDVQLDPREGSCWSNWLIRFNSFHNGLALGFDAPACFQDVRVVGNVGILPSADWWYADQCFQGATGLTWDHNAWVGGTCGPTDIALPALPYVSDATGAENFHLTGGPAVDLVPGTTSDQQLATDIDRQNRSLGPARDAGSDELR